MQYKWEKYYGTLLTRTIKIKIKKYRLPFIGCSHNFLLRVPFKYKYVIRDITWVHVFCLFLTN